GPAAGHRGDRLVVDRQVALQVAPIPCIFRGLQRGEYFFAIVRRRAGACRQGQDEHQCMDEAGHRPGIMAAVEELKQLGRFEIKGVLGKGAMGLVYDALDPTLGRRVAIKTILTRNLDEATAKHYEMRFKREVHAVARINHANIVQVYDFGTEGDLAYIVMEYIEGKELKDRFDSGEGLDLKSIFRVMGELLDALHFAHEAGVIHRDIKPANVMLD